MSAQKVDPPKLAYTVPEVARAISLSERQVRRMCQNGQIAAKWLGGRILVPTEVLVALLADAPGTAG